MPRVQPQQGNMPAVGAASRITNNVIPDRLYIEAPDASEDLCKRMANESANIARTLSPKLSGRAAAGIKPYWGEGFFGVQWSSPYLWYQEGGIKPFTMRTLAGKVIPMWVDDWTGEMARKNPKAKTRIAINGRRQILIFRRVGKIGARKDVPVRDSKGRIMRWRNVPQSYPGAPGRITHREWKAPNSTTGRIVRLVRPQHVGVRWRHPGLVPREFLHHALLQVANTHGLGNKDVYAVYGRH